MTRFHRSLRPVLLWAIAPLLLCPGWAHGLPIYRLDAGLSEVAAAAVAGPEFVGREAWVIETAGNQDGSANAGERIETRIRLVNVGEATTDPTLVTITVDDPDVVVRAAVATTIDWPAGAARISSFPMDIAPTATPRDVTAILRVEAGGETWHFFFTFPIVAPAVEFVMEGALTLDSSPGGDNDGVAEPGERILPRLSLRNVGAEHGGDVRVSVTVFAADVAVVVGEAVHASWPAGEPRVSGFALDISESALAGDVVVFVTVTAEDAGPWRFSFVVPVVTPSPEFVLRSAWIFDPKPGGNRDGRAVPGERVLPRVRLKNIGTAEARNVEVTIAVADPTITVVDGVVAHASWLVGEARNNGSPAFDVAPNAQPGEFTATVTVAADVGGPWQFEVPFTIAVPDVSFALESSWVFDPQPGGNPGPPRQPRREHPAARAGEKRGIGRGAGRYRASCLRRSRYHRYGRRDRVCTVARGRGAQQHGVRPGHIAGCAAA